MGVVTAHRDARDGVGPERERDGVPGDGRPTVGPVDRWTGGSGLDRGVRPGPGGQADAAGALAAVVLLDVVVEPFEPPAEPFEAELDEVPAGIEAVLPDERESVR